MAGEKLVSADGTPLKGKNSEGACFYDYKILNIKEYKISERKVNKFINYLTNRNVNQLIDFLS